MLLPSDGNAHEAEAARLRAEADDIDRALALSLAADSPGPASAASDGGKPVLAPHEGVNVEQQAQADRARARREEDPLRALLKQGERGDDAAADAGGGDLDRAVALSLSEGTPERRASAAADEDLDRALALSLQDEQIAMEGSRALLDRMISPSLAPRPGSSTGSSFVGLLGGFGGGGSFTNLSVVRGGSGLTTPPARSAQSTRPPSSLVASPSPVALGDAADRSERARARAVAEEVEALRATLARSLAEERARERALDARERALDERERALDARDEERVKRALSLSLAEVDDREHAAALEVATAADAAERERAEAHDRAIALTLYDAEKESATSSDDGWQSWLGCFKTAPLGVSLRVFGARAVVHEITPGSAAARLARPLAQGDVLVSINGEGADVSRGGTLDQLLERLGPRAEWPLSVGFSRSAAFSAQYVAAIAELADAAAAPRPPPGSLPPSTAATPPAIPPPQGAAPPPRLPAIRSSGAAAGSHAAAASQPPTLGEPLKLMLARADRLRLAEFRRTLTTGLLLQRHVAPNSERTVATALYCTPDFASVWW